MASDLDSWAQRLPTVDSVRRLDPGPIGVGSRFEVRQPGLPKAVWAVTDWQERTFTWVSRAPGILSTAVHTVDSDETGSRLALTLEWSGPAAPLIRLLLGRKTQRMVDTEAETFARLAAQD